MSTTAIVILIVVVLVVVALAVGGRLAVRRRRALQNRFGAEYDRVLAHQPSRAAAEQELRGRERKHAELKLQTLAPDARARYAADWVDLQAHFVDSPTTSVYAADALVTGLLSDIGYPMSLSSDDERLALLSVDHAGALGVYRAAHEISLSNARGEASTEQLRQALVHFRALIAELLGEQPVPPDE